MMQRSIQCVTQRDAEGSNQNVVVGQVHSRTAVGGGTGEDSLLYFSVQQFARSFALRCKSFCRSFPALKPF